MPKISKHEDEEVREKRVFSDEGLEKFDACLQKYKKPYTDHKTGEHRMILDWDVIYKKVGVRTDRGVVAELRADGSYYIPQIDFDDKLDQWDRWRGRKMFVGGERAKDYERMAEEVEALRSDKEFLTY